MAWSKNTSSVGFTVWIILGLLVGVVAGLVSDNIGLGTGRGHRHGRDLRCRGARAALVSGRDSGQPVAERCMMRSSASRRF